MIGSGSTVVGGEEDEGCEFGDSLWRLLWAGIGFGGGKMFVVWAWFLLFASILYLQTKYLWKSSAVTEIDEDRSSWVCAAAELVARLRGLW